MLKRLSFFALGLIFVLPLLADSEKPSPQARSRLDHYGDPLPEHAVLRIGTTRLRPGGPVIALGFLPDGNRLVTISSAVQVWEVATGKELLSFAQSNYRNIGALSPNGSLAAVWEVNGVCRVFETTTGKEVRSFPEIAAGAQLLCFSPDNTLLASVAVDMKAKPAPKAPGRPKHVSIWSIATGERLQKLDGGSQGGRDLSLVFSPDGKTLAYSGSQTPSSLPISLWEVATGTLLRQMDVAKSNGGFTYLTFSADGTTISGLNEPNNDLWRWETASGKPIEHTPYAHPRPLIAGFGPDGLSTISKLTDSEVHFFDGKNGTWHRTLEGKVGGITKPAFSADGRFFAAESGASVRIWDLKSGKPLHEFDGHSAAWVRARFTSDAKSIVSSASSWDLESRTFKFWDAATGKLQRQESWAGTTASLSADGQILAVQNEKTRVRNLVTGQQLQELDATGSANSAGAMPMTSDGRYLLVQSTKSLPNESPLSSRISFQRQFQVWDARAGKKLFTIESAPNQKFSCTFTPDGRYLAEFSSISAGSGSAQGTLTFWELATGRKLKPTVGPLPFDEMGVFSPSGRLLLGPPAPNENNHIGVWELATGMLVRKLPVPDKTWDRSRQIVLSADGRAIAAPIGRGGIMLYNLFADQPLAQLAGHRGGVESLDFSRDGKRLVSGGSADATILAWDVTQWTQRPSGSKPLPAEVAADMWAILAKQGEGGAASAYAAIARFLESPGEAVSFLRQHLKPAALADQKEIQSLIADLNSDHFAVRERATSKLFKHGLQSQAALHKAMDEKPSLEVRQRIEQLLSKIDGQLPGELLQASRALELLEMLGTQDACELIEALSRGAPGAWLTQEAAAALGRARARLVR